MLLLKEMFAINSGTRLLSSLCYSKSLVRTFCTAGNASYPSLEDKYKISPSRPVPSNIVRPSYVGKVHQDFPPLHGPIHILSDHQIKGLRSAANLAARALTKAMNATRIGVSLDEIDQIVHDFIVAEEAYPSAIDFMHFPKSLCTSVNDVVAHGVPNSYVLKAGDYVNVDIVCYKDGCHGDNSSMILLNEEQSDGIKVHPDIERLSQVTREAMFVGIDQCRPGVQFSKVGEVI